MRPAMRFLIVDESSDFLGYLKMWDFFREKSRHLSGSQLRKQCKQQFLSFVRLRLWPARAQHLRQFAAKIARLVDDEKAHGRTH